MSLQCNASAWQTLSGSFNFRLQIDNVDLRSKNKIIQELEEWTPSGEILPGSEDIGYGLLFSRQFENREQFSEWFKTFPYPIKVFSSTKDEVVKKRDKKKPKKEKVIKEKKVKKIKRKKRCKKVCSLCHKVGHTKPTCPYKEKIESGKGRMCSICCEIGHNSRNCPENR